MKLWRLLSLAFVFQISSAIAEDASPSKEPDKQPEGVKVGDQWTYDQTDEITGNLTFTYTNTVASVTDKEITLRLTRRGDERRGLVVFDTNWNLLDDGVWKIKPQDGGQGIKPPLQVGKEWRVSETIQSLKTGEFFERDRQGESRQPGKFDHPGRNFRYLQDRCRPSRDSNRRPLQASPVHDHHLVCARDQQVGQARDDRSRSRKAAQ